MRRLFLISVLAIPLAACSAGASAPTVLPTPLATARPTASPTRAPAASPTPNSVAARTIAERIVGRLDELGTLYSNGDGDATGTWANEEGQWLTENMSALLAENGLSDYPTDILALLSAVASGEDQTESIETLLASRDEIAMTFAITTAAATPVPTPAPTAAPTAKPVSYTKLTSRNWAKLIKTPDQYVGRGYQIWACIWQFDAATGAGAFLGNASFKRQEYWSLNGENASFTGDEGKLSDFVEDDVVVMNVIARGSYSYDTQAGGNTTVPAFDVIKITRKGSCE